MSWSVQAQGTPNEVLASVETSIAGYSEGSQSRKEFDAAKPHIDALVGLNTGETAAVTLKAHGHANHDGSEVRVTVEVTRTN